MENFSNDIKTTMKTLFSKRCELEDVFIIKALRYANAVYKTTSFGSNGWKIQSIILHADGATVKVAENVNYDAEYTQTINIPVDWITMSDNDWENLLKQKRNEQNVIFVNTKIKKLKIEAEELREKLSAILKEIDKFEV